MTWYKAAWIDPFFAALDAVAPGRDRASDGTIGDLAHASGTSGHNPDDTPGVSAERQDADTKPEVRAADAGSDLRGAITMQQVVDAILAHPVDRDRLIYIIFDGWIYRAANGWHRETYTGTDKHRTHVHLSGHPNFDDDARPWSSILNLGDDMAAVQTTDASYIDLIYRVNALVANQDVGGGPSKGQVNQLAAALVRIEAKLDAQTAAFGAFAKAITDAGGSVDVAVILEAMDAKLAELAKEQRDAVADLGEGGAAQVRADA